MSEGEVRELTERAHRIEQLLRGLARASKPTGAPPAQRPPAALRARPEDGELQVPAPVDLEPRVRVRLAFARRVVHALGMLRVDDEAGAKDKVGLEVATAFPAPPDARKCFRNRFWFDATTRTLYVRASALERAGDALLDLCHVLAAIRLSPTDLSGAESDERILTQSQTNLQRAGGAFFQEFVRAVGAGEGGEEGETKEEETSRSLPPRPSIAALMSGFVAPPASPSGGEQAPEDTAVRGDPTLYTSDRLSARLRRYQQAARVAGGSNNRR